jgi:hypothetical protein
MAAPRRTTLLIALLATIAALLTVSTVLLWRLLEETSERPSDRAVAPVQAPPLPERETRGSPGALADELDRASRRIGARFDRSLAELTGTLERLARAGDVEGVLAALDRAGRELSALGATPREISALTAAALALSRRASAFFARFDGVDPEALVAALRRDLRSGGRGIRAELRAGVRGIERMERSVRDLDRSLQEMTEVLRAMARDVARLRECAERPVVCR